MKHTINSILALIFPGIIMFVFAVTAGSTADAKERENTGKPFQHIEYVQIDRTEVLREFFRKYNSPLEKHAETFVEVADKYGMDYRLMPAISCVESTCAKFLLPGSHNPFGWGGGYIMFHSYDEAIERVGKGLDEIYFSRGRNTVDKIAPVYTPPNYVKWSQGVKYFMQQMDNIQKA